MPPTSAIASLDSRARPTPQDIDEIPDDRDRLVAAGASSKYQRPVCKGPIEVKDRQPLRRDIEHLKAALASINVSEGFMNAVSPGTVAVFQPNEYYPSHRAYVEALSEAMREEYETIVQSGLLLQIDCPDLAMGAPQPFSESSEEQFLSAAEIQVEALNHALANVPADRVRMHVCWGNYDGPHIYDIELVKILPLLSRPSPWPFCSKAPTHGTSMSGRFGSRTSYHPIKSWCRVCSIPAATSWNILNWFVKDSSVMPNASDANGSSPEPAADLALSQDLFQCIRKSAGSNFAR